MKTQAKNIADTFILSQLNDKPKTLFQGASNSIDCESYPTKVVKAKLNSLIKRGLVSGCICGCRGDFILVKKD